MLIFNAVIDIFALVILVFLRALIVFDKRNELEISFWAVKDEQSFNFVTPNFIFIRNIFLESWWINLTLGLSFLFFDQIFPKRYIRRNYNYLTRKISPIIKTIVFFLLGDLLIDRKFSILFLFIFLW